MTPVVDLCIDLAIVALYLVAAVAWWVAFFDAFGAFTRETPYTPED